MKIRFPKLDKILSTNKRLEDSHFSKKVHVYNDYAIVSSDIIAVVNIRAYVESYIGISNDDYDEFNKIMDLMNGNSFSKTYWSNLTKMVELLPNEDSLTIASTGVHIDLINMNTGSGYKDVLKSAVENIYLDKIKLDKFPLDGYVLDSIYKGFSNEMKRDIILFSSVKDKNKVMFSFKNKPYIFGYFNADLSNESIPSNQYAMNFKI